MDPLYISIIGLAAFFLVISQGVPIAYAFAMVGFVGMFLLKGNLTVALNLIGSAPFVWSTNGGLLAIPLFVLMGQFVFQPGISSELFQTAYKWVGRFPGGLAMASNLASTAFGACSGASVASAATLGTIAYPEMEKFGYSPRLATGAIVAGGALAALIPPSVPFIMYGVLTEQSIAKLFIAGVLPGLLLSSMYTGLIIFMAKHKPELAPRGPAFPMREMLASLKGVLGVVILFLLVIGGLFAGVFAPAEAGAMGAFGAFMITLVRRRLTFSSFLLCLKEAMKSTCFILTITIGAMVFSTFMAVGGFSIMFRDWVAVLPFSRHVILIMILLMYIPLGMVMDGLAMLLLTLPIVYPIVIKFGFDPIWFGIISTLIVEMALVTPPVALSCYVVHGVTNVPLEDVFRGILPFFLTIFVCIAVLYAFPQITLFLPNVMG